MPECTCLICHTTFHLKTSAISKGRGKYCSFQCRVLSQFRSEPNTTCLNCNKPFRTSPNQTKKGKGKYCSVKCQVEIRSKKIVCICLVCKKVFKLSPSLKSLGYGRYCSLNCRILGKRPQSSTEKQCNICLVMKNIKEFSRRLHGKFGVNAQCKSCASQDMKYRRIHYTDEQRKDVNNKRALWRKTHKIEVRILNAKHRFKRRSLLKTLIHERIDLESLSIRDNWTCHICGKKVTRQNWSIDHLIPVSVSGSSHTWINVALAHRRCNSKRGAGRIPAQLRLLP